ATARHGPQGAVARVAPVPAAAGRGGVSGASPARHRPPRRRWLRHPLLHRPLPSSRHRRHRRRLRRRRGPPMLSPKKVRHRKQHRGRMRGLSKGGTKVNFGDFGLQAIEPGWITSRQIESARVAITRHVKRGGKVWINIFPDKPYTKKPAETRMGSGKGNPE